MNEAPSVIGILSVDLSSGRSFETAIRDAAKNGPKNIAALFSKVMTDADCRISHDIKAGVFDILSKLPKELSSFRRAMHTAIAAFESNDKKESESMMKEAEECVLQGLKNVGEGYSSRLTTPCMIVFALGIMVPMILISVLPMLSLGGKFSVSGIDSGLITVMTLVVIPAVIGVIILSMKGKNPFFSVRMDPKEFIHLLPLLSAIPIYLALVRYGLSDSDAIIFSAVAAGIFAVILMVPSIMKGQKRIKAENMLKDALFDIGNRLSARENFDNAVCNSFATRKDCSWLSEAIEREMDLCRGDVASALRTVLSPLSEMMCGFYCEIYEASKRDIRTAGKLALSIARQLQDQDQIRKGIEHKLKSMLDMMTGTASVFAPIILGMTVVMMVPISEITGTVFFADISSILVIYLIELSALIAILSSNLMSKGGMMDIQCRFCAMMPIALIVFRFCSSITL